MARVIYSALVTSIRGSIGGTTFQKNKFGFTAKNKPKMVLPLSPAQANIKYIMARLTTYWKTLTNADRQAWVDFANTYPQYAKHSPTDQLTGYNLFIMWNMQWLVATFANNGIMDAPALTLPALSTVDLSLSLEEPSDMVLTNTWTPSGLLWYATLYMTKPIPPSINFIGSQYRVIGLLTSEGGAVSIKSAYLSQYAKLPEAGDRIGVRLVLFSFFGGRVMSPSFQILTVS